MKITRNSGMFYLFICCLLIVSFLWKCETDQPIRASSIESQEIYSIKDVSEKPEMLVFQEPVYPQKAIDQGIEGFVHVDVVINEKGEVIQSSVNEEASIPLLNTAALEAARVYKKGGADPDPLLAKAALAVVDKCKFQPAMVDGKPVKVKMNIPYRFHLQ